MLYSLGHYRVALCALLISASLSFAATDVNVINIPSVREVNASAHYTWDYWGAVGSGANGQQRLTDIKTDLDNLRQALCYHFAYQYDGIPVSQNVEDIANYLSDVPNIYSLLGYIRDDVDDIRIINEEFRHPMTRLNNSFLRASESGANKLWVTSGVENAIAAIPDLISSNNLILSAILEKIPTNGLAGFSVPTNLLYSLFTANYLDDPAHSFANNLADLQDESMSIWDKFAYYGIWGNTPLSMAYQFDIRQLEGGVSGSPIGYFGEQKALMDFWRTFMDVYDLAWYETISDKVGPFAALNMKYYSNKPLLEMMNSGGFDMGTTNLFTSNGEFSDEAKLSTNSWFSTMASSFVPGISLITQNAEGYATNDLFVTPVNDLLSDDFAPSQNLSTRSSSIFGYSIKSLSDGISSGLDSAVDDVENDTDTQQSVANIVTKINTLSQGASSAVQNYSSNIPEFEFDFGSLTLDGQTVSIPKVVAVPASASSGNTDVADFYKDFIIYGLDFAFAVVCFAKVFKLATNDELVNQYVVEQGYT